MNEAQKQTPKLFFAPGRALRTVRPPALRRRADEAWTRRRRQPFTHARTAGFDDRVEQRPAPARPRRRRAPRPHRAGVEPRRRGPGRHRPDRPRSTADRDRDARHRQAARRDAGADRRHPRALRPLRRALPARCRRRWSPSSAATARTRCGEASSCARRAARCARSSRSAACWPAARPGSPACGASSRATAPRSPSRRSTTPAASSSARSPTGAGPTSGTTCVVNDVPYNALHDRFYPEHRLRAVHPRGRRRRGLPRRALVVGAGGAKECGLHVAAPASAIGAAA